MYIIGIDGGGTKTEALLFHPQQGRLASFVEGASNPHSTSFECSTDLIIRMVQKIFASPFLSNDKGVFISIGIAGLGRKADKEKWLELLHSKYVFPNRVKRIDVESDAFIALYSGTYGRDGIVSICGTGSITFGVNKQNVARVGGWGHLIGSDPGSGYYIGYQALKAVFQSFDGLEPETKILPLLLDGEHVTEVTQLVQYIYGSKNIKDKIASFSKYVFLAAQEKDEIAQQIIYKTAVDIVRFGVHVHRKLFKQHQKVPFVLAGGVCNNQFIIDNVVNNLPNILDLIVLDDKPVIGSIVHAMKQLGYSNENIKNSLTYRVNGCI